MDPVWKLVLWVIAIVLAVLSSNRPDYRGWRLFPLAFAVFVVPFAWDAGAAT